MRIIQFRGPDGGARVGVVRGDRVHDVTACHPEIDGTHAAFQAARRLGRRLADLLQELMDADGSAVLLPYAGLLNEGRVLAPVDERPGTRILVSGTGLTHLGSVRQRDSMHRGDAEAGPKSDSRRMFEWGIEGGKPGPGERGVAAEWFYKGDGRILRGPGQPLDIPAFAPEGGEEPEVAAIYAVDEAGIPCRLGFVQGNEWSDHVTEKRNYLYLAPSKLRVCSIGPELVTDFAFDDVRGRCRVVRDGRVMYDSGELLTGEKHMCHSLANLEDHHFKFPEHRLPGDVHVHFLGTSTLSYGRREWTYQTGDRIEVAFDGMGVPLCNSVLRLEASSSPIRAELG